MVNLGLVYLVGFLLRRDGGALNLPIALFFVLLLTLIVTLYDRCHLVHEARFLCLEVWALPGPLAGVGESAASVRAVYEPACAVVKGADRS